MAEDRDKKCRESKPGVSRRGFIVSVGTGAMAATLASTGGLASAPAEAQEIPDGAEMVRVALDINGRVHRLLVEARWSLLFVLRERLGLTGSKQGCERGECGVCTVLIDDVPRYACMTLAVEAEGHTITTIEGLMKGEELGPTQQAFVEHDAFQCGYCTPGQIMAVEGVLRQNPNPTVEDIRHGVSGNLCRCATYKHIFNAGLKAAELRRKGGQL